MTDGEHAGAAARSHPALIDPETGLANRLHFDLVYNYLFAAGARGLPFTVMVVSAGSGGPDSEELAVLGQTIHGATRRSDLVTHRGGGRFVVLLLGTNLSGARVAADRIEGSLGPVARAPVCFGVSAYAREVESSDALLAAAETALESAEAAGGGIEYA